MIEIPRMTKGGDNRNWRPNLFLNLDPIWWKLPDSINLLQQSLQESPEQLGKREQTTTRRISCINNIALSMHSRMNNIINYSYQTSGKRSSRFLMQYLKLRCFCLKKCYWRISTNINLIPFTPWTCCQCSDVIINLCCVQKNVLELATVSKVGLQTLKAAKNKKELTSFNTVIFKHRYE